jgi:hypothetical protein
LPTVPPRGEVYKLEAFACQAEGRGFKSHRPLQQIPLFLSGFPQFLV